MNQGADSKGENEDEDLRNLICEVDRLATDYFEGDRMPALRKVLEPFGASCALETLARLGTHFYSESSTEAALRRGWLTAVASCLLERTSESIERDGAAAVIDSLSTGGIQLVKSDASLPMATECFERALDLANQHRRDGDADMATWWARVHARWGYALNMAHDFAAAARHGREALAILSELTDGATEQVWLLIARTRLNLGISVIRDGEPADGVVQIREALPIFERLIECGAEELWHDIASARTNLGCGLNDCGDSAGAIGQFIEAVPIFERLIKAGSEDLWPEVAMALANWGRSLHEVGNPAAASEKYRQAVPIFERLINEGKEYLWLDVAKTRMNWGNSLCIAGYLAESIMQYKEALSVFERLIKDGKEHLWLYVAHACVNLGGSLRAQGDPKGAITQYRVALPIFVRLIKEGNERLWPDVAKARTNWGNSLQAVADLAGAITQYSDAVSILQRLILNGAEHLRSELAQTRMNWGVCFSDHGDTAGAINQYQEAMSILERLIDEGKVQVWFDVAKTRMNWGTSLFIAGDLVGAIMQYSGAMSILQRLITGGAEHLWPEVAKTRMNWGNCLQVGGDSASAIEQHREALLILERLIMGGAEHLWPEVAKIRMNWGNCLLNAGYAAGAVGQYRKALSILERLFSSGEEHQLPEIARARINLANSLNVSGDWLGAVEQNREVLSILLRLIDSGMKQCRPLAALVQKNLGQIFLERGHLADAAHQFRCELRLHAQMVAEGLEAFLPAQFDAVLSLWIVSPHDASSAVTGTGTRGSDLIMILREISASRRQLPDAALWQCMETCGRLSWHIENEEEDSRRAGMGPLAGRAWGVWLECALRLLGSGGTGFLRSHLSIIRDHVDDMLSMRLRLSERPTVLDWVLHTQGLRAQADLLVGHPDTQVRALAALLRQIADIERVLLGEHASVQLTATFISTVANVSGSSKAGASTFVDLDGAIRQIASLRQQADTLREALEQSGTLPEVPEFTAGQILERLTVGEQIWLLYPLRNRAEGSSLILIRLSRDGGDARVLREDVQTLDLPDDQTWTCQLDRLGHDLSLDMRAPVRRAPVVRDAGMSGIGNPESAFEPEVVEALRDALWKAAQPADLVTLLREESATGKVNRIHIIPLGDAHALPWVNSLMSIADKWQPPDRIVMLRQYPSMAAWMVADEFVQQNKQAPSSSIRPAMVFDDARFLRLPKQDGAGLQSAYLPAVGLELQYSRACWEQQMPGHSVAVLHPDTNEGAWPPQAGDADFPVGALFGFGHGGAPAGNWALSGLLMPTGCRSDDEARSRFLSAQHLPGLRHAERLYLSCCVLGRTDDQLGEPLGLLALAFGFRTRVAIGSLLPVNDLAAALISLAFQWELGQRGAGSDWVPVFHDVRLALRSGHWPTGFEDWMAPRVLRGLQHPPDWLNGLMNLVGLPDWLDRAGQNAFEYDFCRALQTVPTSVRAAIDWFAVLG